MRRVLDSQFPVVRRKILGRLFKASNRGLRISARFSLKTGFLLAALVSFAPAQQIDLAGGASTLWSASPHTASQAFLPPAESGGTYASGSVQYFGEKRLGINIEGALRAKQGLYNGYQFYRPILYDVNAVLAHRLAAKMRGDLMAGVGGETLLFYNQTNCNYSSGCRLNVDNTHFLMHFGAGVRYYVWKNFFVRPEAHYYFIPNNFEFHSDHVLRVGASIGHTFQRR
jgi:hypothetical protein